MDIEDQVNTREKFLKGLVYTNPLGLLMLTNQKDIDYINNLLPYSTGFEIECGKKEFANNESFKKIPFIMRYDINESEQRFRIPNGINGLICLYNISIQAKINLALNMDSGIHYHIDCTDCYSHLINTSTNLMTNIIIELESWNYKGYYNKKSFDLNGGHGWIRRNSLGTLEFRIGEMTFDYEIWVNRIVHANSLVRLIKQELGYTHIEYDRFEKDPVLQYLKELPKDKLKELEKFERKSENPNKLVSNRTMRI